MMMACLAGTLGCAQPQPAPIDSHASDQRPIAWPDDWSGLIGQKVTVEGWAGELKLGPYLSVDAEFNKGFIFIDGHGWPDGYFGGPGKSKHVRVTGTVIKRDDVPVFMAEKESRPIGERTINPDGIPVYSQEEFDRWKWRYLLSGVTWKVLD